MRVVRVKESFLQRSYPMAEKKMAERKVIWAVDPFCDDCRLTRRTAWGIHVLAAQWNAEIEPVYILGDLPPTVAMLPLGVRDI